MTNYQDKILTCRDCGATFIFGASEQEFFASKGFRNDPARCLDCRRLRRQQMRALRSAPRQMHPVVCDRCGVETEVPFQPTGIKPVYCPVCFDALRGRQAPAGRPSPSHPTFELAPEPEKARLADSSPSGPGSE